VGLRPLYRHRRRGRETSSLLDFRPPSACATSMSPSFTTRRGRRYASYRCAGAAKRGHASCPIQSISAGMVERAVVSQLRIVLQSPEVTARVIRESKFREAEEINRLRADGNVADARVLEANAISENDIVESLKRFDSVWAALFPDEQHRITQLLVERVDVSPDGLELRLRADGLASLLAELRARSTTEEPACP
jgi:site-specific DNA recombinase